MKIAKATIMSVSFLLLSTVTLLSQVVVTGSTGADGSYTTLKAAFDAVNASVQTANNIDIAITANTTEMATAELHAGDWTSLVIHPSGGARTVLGNLPDLHNPGTDPLDVAYTPPVNAVIKLTGADNVTIDGSLAGGTDRSLTITNTAGDGTRSIVILVKSGGIGNGADNNTVKNTILTGARGATSTLGTFGILSFNDPEPNNYGGVSVPNSYNTIQNNLIKKMRTGVLISSSKVVTFDPNWVITGNTLGSTVADEKLADMGLQVSRAQNFTISNNTINGIYRVGGTYSAGVGTTNGISVSNSDGGAVTGNRISDVKMHIPKPQGPITVYCSNARGVVFHTNSTAATITVANNFIWDVAGSGCGSNYQSFSVFGMYFLNGKYDVFHNSVNLNTNSTQYHYTAAILVSNSSGSSIDLRNNILANTATAGNRYAIYAYSTTNFTNIDYNDYFAQHVGAFNDGVSPSYTRSTLADWRVSTGQDLNSKAVNPLFVSPTDLHLQGTSPLIDAGVFLAAISTDIDGQTRPQGAVFDIGADENTFTMPATATIGGKVLKASGQGIRNATVTLSGGTLSQPISVTTNSSGAYQFPAVQTGQNYIVTVSANGYTFATPSQFVFLTANVANLNFTAN